MLEHPTGLSQYFLHSSGSTQPTSSVKDNIFINKITFAKIFQSRSLLKYFFSDYKACVPILGYNARLIIPGNTIRYKGSSLR